MKKYRSVRPVVFVFSDLMWASFTSFSFVSCDFMSCYFMCCSFIIFTSCHLVRQFHVYHFQRPQLIVSSRCNCCLILVYFHAFCGCFHSFLSLCLEHDFIIYFRKIYNTCAKLVISPLKHHRGRGRVQTGGNSDEVCSSCRCGRPMQTTATRIDSFSEWLQPPMLRLCNLSLKE